MNNSSGVDMDVTQSLGRKIRLKHLLDEGIAIENMVNQKSSFETLEAIRNIIVASDNIINEGCVEDRAEHTTEVVLDAQVLKIGHELVSKVLLQNSDFNDRVYQNGINSIVFRDDVMNWEAIGERAFRIAYTTRTKSTMLGAVDVELSDRVVKERQHRKRNTLAEEKQPETIDKMRRQDKGAQKVNIIHQQIAYIFKNNNRQPIPFYKLVIDPSNFMHSVENAFQLAFLARDSFIAIETGEDGYPHVRLVTTEERKAEKDANQSICSLNMKTCDEMISFYSIKEAMLSVPPEAEDNE